MASGWGLTALLLLAMASGGDGANEITQAQQRYSGDPTCKNGYTLHEDTSANILGCYRLFQRELSWPDAKAACEADNGRLAAARNTKEHDVLMGLAGGSRFWNAGSSLRTTDTVYRWDGYGEAINIDSRLYQAKVRVASSWPDQHVILDGNVVTPAWTQISEAQSKTRQHFFICRKDACPAGKDIDAGLCATIVSTKTGSQWWIAVVVLVVLAGLLVLVCGLLFFFAREKFERTFPCCVRKTNKSETAVLHNPDLFTPQPRGGAAAPSRLLEESNMDGKGHGGDTEIVPAEHSGGELDDDSAAFHGEEILLPPPPHGLPTLKAPQRTLLPPLNNSAAAAGGHRDDEDQGGIANISAELRSSRLPPPSSLPAHHYQGTPRAVRRGVVDAEEQYNLPGETLK